MNSSEFPSIKFGVFPSTEIEPCSICLNGYPPQGIGATHAVCQHTFHIGCLESWARTQFNKRQPTTCPMCRGELDTPQSYARLNSQLTDYEIEQGLARIERQRRLWSRARPRIFPEDALSSARHESSSGTDPSGSSEGSSNPRGYDAIESMDFSDLSARYPLLFGGREDDDDDDDVLSTTSSGLGISTSSWACGLGAFCEWLQ